LNLEECANIPPHPSGVGIISLPILGVKVMDIRCPSHTSKFSPSAFTFSKNLRLSI
jgi:hypothetical protein